MSRRYLNEMAIGAKVDEVFMIASKELRRTRTGDSFLLLNLSDRTGSVPAYRFDPTGSELELPVGGFVRAEGRMGMYRGFRRLTLDSLVMVSQVDSADFLERSMRPTDEMVSELRERVRSVSDRSVARVLRAAFADRAFFERFCASPLGTTGPYAYVGGLLEHTLAVTATCASLADHHPEIDADLLVGAAIVHDIGTVDAIVLDLVPRETDEGRLLGHIALSDRRIVDAARRAGINEGDSRLLALRHAVAAHHGGPAADSGAGRLQPSTIEAAALAGADQQNLTLSTFARAVAAAVRVDESWTGASNRFNRPLHSRPFIAVDTTAKSA